MSNCRPPEPGSVIVRGTRSPHRAGRSHAMLGSPPHLEGTAMTEHSEHHHAMSYADATRRYRADKDAYFRTGAGSPVPAEDRGAFPGIPYFPVDESLVIEGIVLEAYSGSDPVRFQIPTTDGRLRPAERAGEFRFALMGHPQRLTAYRVASADGQLDESLFVPFLDMTTGTETYGAGRYLDLEPDDDGTWTLDFNFAYHPSCVYDPRFSCPITPPENRLDVRVEAGERLANDHDAPG
jgi:uncharacterized protein (DUF1684 family)